MTSPPYFNAKQYAEYVNYDDYLDWMTLILARMYLTLKPGRFLALNSSPVISPRQSRSQESVRHPIPFDLNAIAIDLGFMFLEDIIWLKPEGAAIRRNGGFIQHRKPLAYKPNLVTEYIMIYRRPSGRLIDHELQKVSGAVLDASLVPDGFETTNVWRINPETDSDHPAPMPVELARRLVRYYSFAGDLVLDPFAGSGTTLLAAWQLDRMYLGCDSDAGYVANAQKRLAAADPYRPTPVSDTGTQLNLFDEQEK